MHAAAPGVDTRYAGRHTPARRQAMGVPLSVPRHVASVFICGSLFPSARTEADDEPQVAQRCHNVIDTTMMMKQGNGRPGAVQAKPWLTHRRTYQSHLCRVGVVS